MKTLSFLFTVALLVNMAAIAFAQNVGINSDGSTPHSSAMLDVSSTNSGILIPRMTEAQRDGISLPATGLMVYQTNGTFGFYYFNGSVWTQIGSGGDINLTTDVTGVLPIANGGTNANSAADARTNLGLGTAALSNTGTAAANIPVLDVNGKIPNSLLNVTGLAYKGSMSLSGNPTVPIEASGNYYIISVGGTETGSGIVFSPADWMISNGTSWQSISNSAAVTSVATKTGAVTLSTGDLTDVSLTGNDLGKVLVWNGTQWAPVTANTGSVTSVAVSGGSTGLTTSGGPVSGSGTITLEGTLAVTNGGTGATDVAGIRTNLGLGTAALANTGTSAANIPVLDGTGKIPNSLLNISGLTYKGNKSLSGNPTVAVEASGNYYIISIAGTEAGSGLAFSAGDWMISNGTVWQSISNSSAVSSVAGRTGIITLTAADITSGTLPIVNGGTGTATGSINGTGALTFAAGGTNQNVTLTPSGTGNTVLNGKVGIGTATPAGVLQVNSSSTTTDGKVIISSPSYNFAQLQIGNPSGAEASMSFIPGVTAFGTAPTSSYTNSAIWTLGSGVWGIAATTFGIGNKEYAGSILNVKSTGSVGIGTSTPAATLDVNGVALSNFEGFSYYSTGTSLPAGAWSNLVISTLDYNTFTGTPYNTSTGQFTAPRAGFYRFSMFGYAGTVNTNTMGDRYAYGVLINGSLKGFAGGNYSAADSPMTTYSQVVRLNANDVVRPVMYSAINVMLGTAGAGHWFYFQCEFVGK